MNEAKNSSHALDLVTVFEEAGTTAEMEALEIQALLKASGIRVVLGNEASFPNLPWSVQVPKADAARALKVLGEAKKAGPKAAAEAEAAQERSKK
jgi:hypothetical protein